MTLVLDAPAVLEIVLGGVSVDEVAAALVTAVVEQRLNAPAACELTLNDSSGQLSAVAKLGGAVSIRAGLERRTIFEGTIAQTEIEARGESAWVLRVLAYDALDVLRRGSPVRVHSDVGFVDLARELTRRLNLTIDAAPAGSVRPRIVQHRRSDLDLLIEASERAGVYFRLEGSTLRLYPIVASGVEKRLEFGSDVRECSVTLNAVDAAATVNVSGWDPHKVRAFHGTATHAAGSADVQLTNVVVSSDTQADAVARSQIERRAATAAVAWLVVDGDPALAAGDCVRLAQLPQAYCGPFRMTSATHRFTPSLGYVVELSSALPAPYPPGQEASATLGVVSDVRDPEGLGRIKVRYPALHDAESDWLQLVAAGAGGKKGLVALPAVEDLVLVLVVDDDPANAVVLGALYGSGGLPGERARTFKGYALYSPGGHLIELDDDGSLTVRTSGGTSIELGRDRSTLHSETDLTIEAPGKTVTIAAKAVEVKQR